MAGVAPPVPPGWRALAGWTALDLVLAGTLAFGFSLLLAALFSLGRSAGWVSAPPVPGLGGLPALFIPLSVAGTALAGLVLHRLHRARLPVEAPPWSPRLALLVVLAALGLQAAAVGFALLANALGAPNAGTNLGLVQQALVQVPVPTLLAVLVLAPVGEELVFRRVLLERFARAGLAWPGLLFTALVFALIHEPLPAGRSLAVWGLTLAPYALLSLGFGLFYLRVRRIDATILAHALVNALGLLLLRLGA